jgi:DNA-binding transcriptional ArsR family regulator
VTSHGAAAGDPFEALGDPHRRAIVELLAAGGEDGRSVGELARELPISRPAVSRHLRLLREAGLVAEKPRGTRRIYRLRGEGLDAVRAYLERVWGEAAARFRLMADNTAPPAASASSGSEPRAPQQPTPRVPRRRAPGPGGRRP